MLIGPNGAGKSSLLQTLLIWRNSVGAAGLKIPGGVLDLGQADDVSRSDGGAAPRLGFDCVRGVHLPTLAENKPDVTIKFSCDASIAPIPARVAGISSGPLTYKTEWDEENGRINRNEFQYGNATYGLGASRDLPGLAQLSGSSGQPNKELRDDLEAIIQVGARSLQDIRHVPPVRGFLRSRYELGSQPAAEFTSSVNPDEDASQLSTTLAYESSLRSQVSELMADITGVRLSHSLRPGQLTAVVSNRSVDGSEKEIVPTNEGFGTNQLVHLITQVLLTPVGGTVLIEEPETHLHPGAQVKLDSLVKTRFEEVPAL